MYCDSLTLEADYGYHERRWQRDAKGFQVRSCCVPQTLLSSQCDQDVAPFLESVHDRPFAMHEADDDHERYCCCIAAVLLIGGFSVARGAADPVRMIGGLAVADMIYTEMQTESKYQAAVSVQMIDRRPCSCTRMDDSHAS